MTDDLNFDLMLEEAATELPPTVEQTREITPWRQAMKRIVWGVALTSITLNFWWLNYILPVVGVIFTWLGYRALRDENRYFFTCWIISIIGLGTKLVELILKATPYHSDQTNWLLSIPGLILTVVELLCLWKGIRAVRRKAGQPDQAGAVIALLVWDGVLVIAAMFGAGGWLVLLPLLVAYIAILYNLGKIPALLDDAGYEVQASRVRLSDPAAGVLYAVALLLCICVVGALNSRYPMDWKPVDPNEQAEYTDTVEKLRRQGMPEEIMADLSADDLEELRNSIWVFVQKDYHSFTQSVDDENKIRFTHVAVKLPGERLKLIHHFEWIWEPPIRTTECIKLWPAYGGNDVRDYGRDSEITGRLLYDLKGETYTGAFYEIREETYDRKAGAFGFGGGTTTDTFLNFSLPLRGERLRGYFSYSVTMNDEGVLLSSWPNYLHQMSPINYPMMTAEEYDKTGASNFSGCFIRAQTALQFRPSEPKRWNWNQN